MTHSPEASLGFPVIQLGQFKKRMIIGLHLG